MAAALIACGGDRSPVRIAVAFHGSNIAVAALAVEEINAAGGVGGAPVELVRDTVNEVGDPADVEVRRAESIVAQMNIIGVIGHGGSRQSLAAAQVYNRAGVVQLVPTGTSRLLQHAGPWTLPLPPDDSAEGAFIAAFVKQRLGVRRVAVFYVNEEYGFGLRDGLRASLPPVTMTRAVRIDPASEVGPMVDAVLRDRPEAVIIAARPPSVAAIVRRLDQRGSTIPVVAGDGADNFPLLAHTAGPAAQGRLYVATFWVPSAADSASRRFVAKVRERLGRTPSATDVLLYDAVYVLVDAVARAGRDRAAVRDAIAALGVSRAPFRGVAGPIGFGAERPPLLMGVVRGDSLVPVEPQP